MLGVPVNEASALLGVNQLVITSCSILSSNLKKKHKAIAYHRIREAVAAGIVNSKYIKSQYNLADAITKALHRHLPNYVAICGSLFVRSQTTS